MKHLTRFACLSLCALSLLSSTPARRGLQAHAAQNNVEQQGGAQVTVAPVVTEIDVEGLKKVLARDEKKRKPLLVNFWATWCGPCRAEFPDLIKIDEEYRARGLDFITISIDDASEIKTTVPQFLKEMNARMPAFLLNTPEPEVAIAYVDPRWSGSLPATFLYDAQGKIVFKHLGRIKPDELRAAIKTVISDK